MMTMTENKPYPEPGQPGQQYPKDWTPKQCENWDEYGQEIYEQLETDVGQYWYRRTWRTKMRGDGMMEADHVKFGSPEDYVAYMVDDKLDMWADLTGAMMREIGSYENKEELDEAVSDIVQAKISLMDEEQQAQLLEDATDVVELYGL